MEFPDLGPLAIGRGSAFVARADNPSAFYYNPAGLAKLRGGHVLLGSNIVNLNASFLRAGSGQPQDFGTHTADDPALDFSDGSGIGKAFTESTQTGFGPAPMLVGAWGASGAAEGLVISMGVIPPSSFGGHRYQPDGPQRYNLGQTRNMILFPGIGVSYGLSRYIQVGAVFLSGMGFVDISRASRPVPQQGSVHHNEDLFNDATFRVEANDYFMPTGIVGVLSMPTDWLEVGASARLPVHMEARGQFHYAAPDAHKDYTLVDEPNSAVLTQELPTIVRAGGRYIHPHFDVELDFVWENWATLQHVDLEANAALDKGDGSAPTPLPSVQLPRNFRDTYSLRLGGDVWAIPEKLAVRVGGFAQTSAYPDNRETFSLDFPYDDQLGVGGGVSWHVIEHLSVHAGYSHVFQRTVEVDEGIVQQTGLLWAAPGGGEYNIGNTVNNGRYEVSLNLFGLSLEGRF